MAQYGPLQNMLRDPTEMVQPVERKDAPGGNVSLPLEDHQQDYSIFFRARSKKLVVFVHGLNGDKTSKYWSRIPELVSNSKFSPASDFLFYNYKTNLKLFPNALAFLKRDSRVSEVEEVVSSLVTLLSQGRFLQYSEIRLVGHSLGGLICIEAAYKFLHKNTPDKRITHVCAAASPIGAEEVAKSHSRVSGYSNPHIRYLASHSRMRRVYGECIRYVKSQGILTTYMRAIGDQVVTEAPLAVFDDTLEHQGDHTWTADVDGPSNTAFVCLKSWISS